MKHPVSPLVLLAIVTSTTVACDGEVASTTDAGMSPTDGATRIDVGTTTDGGTTFTDGTTPPIDTGRRDASRPPRDSGVMTGPCALPDAIDVGERCPHGRLRGGPGPDQRARARGRLAL